MSYIYLMPSIRGSLNEVKSKETETCIRTETVMSFFFLRLLTVHHVVILGKWPTWRTILSMYLFLFLTLYMFRAHRVHHQERQIVSIQSLVTVSVCRCPFRVQVVCEYILKNCASRWSFTKNHCTVCCSLLFYPCIWGSVHSRGAGERVS
jgi:hypothetical protein